MSDNELAIIGEVAALKHENAVLRKQVEVFINRLLQTDICPSYKTCEGRKCIMACRRCWYKWSRVKAESQVKDK